MRTKIMYVDLLGPATIIDITGDNRPPVEILRQIIKLMGDKPGEGVGFLLKVKGSELECNRIWLMED